MTSTIAPEVAQELIKFKLHSLQETISTILSRWEESNVDDFIQKVRSGELVDAEMDAITIRQLAADVNKLRDLLKSVRTEES